MVLVTAISRAKRLDKFLPQNVVVKYAFRDRAVFDFGKLYAIAKKHSATSLLVTCKDLVKLKNFSFAISVLELEIIVGDRLLTALENYYRS
ncbi:MAG: tetraacyldisaccharide 4'-kinase [Helicobacteraceae bacterium]|jgi:tetraacyldisaccharide 4'-kinase|nr:tetraacyldisaccharide 4'-kinase [Helicobacteraceae bacterium]